ncbi:MAG: DNA photolyase [Thermodesulfobacteriota bacterium]|nr:DNA photolyase [Thermodesulfobacteriota bacterium]
MIRYTPARVIIHNAVRDSVLTGNLLENLSEVPVEYVDNPAQVIDAIKKERDPFKIGKKTLLLTENRGKFLKSCPGTNNYICCGYQILNFATNCNMDCTYCVLQAYLNNPPMIVYANVDDMFAELDERIDGDTDSFYRIGTGEFTDSLTLDHLLGFTRLIVPYFAEKRNAVLELKTKTVNIENLAGLHHGGKVLTAWSLNTDSIAKREELLAPSMDQRIDAAFQCQKMGYELAFHFDPLIYYPGWEDGYRRTLDKLFARIDPEYIAWMSMGCFRFVPELKPIIQRRFPFSKIIYEEFIPGLDGKMRYFKPLRMEIYSKMREWLREYTSDLCLYLCMESSEVWREVFGDNRVKSSEDLAATLDKAGGAQCP